MTCIAGVVDRTGNIYMGGDSAAIADCLVHIRSDPKVFVRQEMIFGFTGSFRMGQLIQYRLKIPGRPKSLSDHAFLSTRFVDAIRSCFKKGGYCKRENEREEGEYFCWAIEDTFTILIQIFRWDYGTTVSMQWEAVERLSWVPYTRHAS